MPTGASKNGRELTMNDVVAELKTANKLLSILVTRGMEQRAAIALLHSMSFPPREIAASLSITANAVSIALYKMKKAEAAADVRARPEEQIDGRS